MRKLLGILSILVFVTNTFAFDAKHVALQYIKSQKQQFNLSDQDIKDLVAVEQTTEENGYTQFWFQQTANGIPLKNGYISVLINTEGKVAYSSGKGVLNLQERANLSAPKIDAAASISKLASHLDVKNHGAIRVSEILGKKTMFEQVENLTKLPVEAELEYIYDEKDGNKVKLCWDIRIHSLDETNFWNISIDADQGSLVAKQDLITHCSFGHNHNPYGRHFVRIGEEEESGSATEINTNGNAANNIMAPVTASYRVYPYYIESPPFGSRILFTHDSSAASPYGWHDTDGTDAANFTTTRGNNVYAYQDKDGNNAADAGSAPDGTASLTFDFTLNLGTQLDTLTNAKAGVTQLFYMNNIMHDIFQRYGFTEAEGNFQMKNYTQTGGNDFVWAEAHDGAANNNANFYASIDGQNTAFDRTRMQMFMWDDFAPTTLTATAPAPIAGDYECGRPAFGPCTFNVTGSLANAVSASSTPPSYVCGTVTNQSEVNGKIALIDRGTCNFSEKVYNAQLAGAIGVIIINRQSAGDSLITMAAGTNATLVTIPSVFVTYATGQILRNNIGTAVVNMTKISTQNCLEGDGSLDNGIVAHEYGHGITIRMTGPLTTNTCLTNAEEGGEGWSDFFALALTHKASDTKNTARGIGNYVFGEGPTGSGIRNYPYSYDMAVNPLTYEFVETSGGEVHDIGEVWCVTLWDMYWNLVEKHGYSNDLYAGTAGTKGNQIALELVIEGLKRQPCNPGFLDARNAILAADSILNGFANKCEIWSAFARRGMGFSAVQGSSNNTDDQVAAYNMPPSCNLGPQAGFSFSDDSVCIGGSLTFTNTSTGSPDSVRWTINGGTPSTSTSTTTVTPTFNTAGTFQVSLVVYKAGNASSPFSVNVVVKPLPNTNAGTDVSVCAGSSTTLTATGATSYQWTGGPATAGYTVTPSGTTTYTVTGTTLGCTRQDQVTVTVNPLPNVSAGSDQSICPGQSATLTATGATSYQWTGGPATAGYTVTPATTTDYIVTGTSGVCSKKDTVKVTVKPLPSTNAGLDVTICTGNSTTLTATGATTYQWTGGPATAGYTVSPTVTTTYTVTGTTNGCSAADNVTVTVTNVAPNVTITTSTGNASVCSGQSITLTGNGAGTYQWTGGPATAGYTVSPTSSTNYTVTGTVTGCPALFDTQTVQIIVKPLPLTDAGANQTICNGQSATLTASGATTYQWTGGPATAGYTVSPTTTTAYTVTGTTDGCSASDNVTVTVNNAPAPGTITQRNDTIFTSGTGASYNWYRGGVFVSSSSVPYLKITQSGSYQVEVVGANTCISAKSAAFSATLTGIRTNTLNIQYNIIPNPNNGEFEVRIVSNKTAQYDLVLYNVTGQELMREEINIVNGVNSKRYNFSKMSSGVYFLSLMGAEGVSTQNLVIH